MTSTTAVRTTTKTLRAARYVRISEDRYGEAEGVDRQLEAADRLAVARGLNVVGTYEDNDRSATRGERPEYDRMIAAIERGEIDIILVKWTDRLYRLLVDLIPLTDVLKRHGVLVYSEMSGDVDLSTADGRLRANIMGSVSQHSSEVQAERLAAAAAQRAQRGRFLGGIRRFGYMHRDERMMLVRPRGGGEAVEMMRPTGPLVLVPDEAEAIAWAYEHVLRGGTLESCVREIRRRGLAGPQGAAIKAGPFRDILLRSMNAGITTFKGEELLNVKSEIPTIIDPETFRAVRAILMDPSRRIGAGRPAISLLAPVLRCAICGGRMGAATKPRPRPGNDYVYRCKAVGDKAAGLKGNHVQRQRDKLDDIIGQLVFRHVIDNADRLIRPATTASGAMAAVSIEAEKLRGQLAAHRAAAGDVDPEDMSEYLNVIRAVKAKLAVVEAKRVVAVGKPATSTLLRSDDAAATWRDSTVEERRAVIAEQVDRIEVGRGLSGPRNGTMANVNVVWREI